MAEPPYTDASTTGLGDAEERLTPTSVTTLESAGATSIACGAEYTLALAGDHGDVYSWGWCAGQHHCEAVLL